MATLGEPVDGRHGHLSSATADSSLSAILADLVSQPGGDATGAIDLALEALAESPADRNITPDVFENLGVLFAHRYRTQQDINDLQAAITWAEQGAEGTPTGNPHPARIRCHINLASYLISRYEASQDQEDLHEAVKRVEKAFMAVVVAPPRIENALALHETAKKAKGCLEKSGDRSGHSISGRVLGQEASAVTQTQPAFTAAEQALAQTPLGEPNRAERLESLCILLRSMIERVPDLPRAIVWLEEAVASTPLNHPDRAGYLINLARLLELKFERTGSLEDLDTAILRHEQAVNLTPLNNPQRADHLSDLSVVLGRRFERTGSLDDLEMAILRGEEAVAMTATSLDHPQRAIYLKRLGGNLGRRFTRLGAMDDLNRAIVCCEEAVAANPLGHADRAGSLNNLCVLLVLRFERTSALDDIDTAIVRAQEVVDITPLNNPNRAMFLDNLGGDFGLRFERTGALDDLEMAISRCEEAVAATPLDHPERASRMSKLGVFLGRRFERTGALHDLEMAISRAEEAVATTPLNQPRRAVFLNSLGSHLGLRFERTGALADLEMAILRCKQAVAATPLNYPQRPMRLSNLGHFHRLKFERTRSVDDLEMAIVRCEEAVAATSRDHPNRPIYLDSLSNILARRLRRTEAQDDLESAILRSEEAVAATSLDHPNRPTYLDNLGHRFILKFARTAAVDDLQMAILRCEEAVVATPLDHADRARRLYNLGNHLCLRHKSTGDRHDCIRAIGYFTDSAGLHSASPTLRIQAAMAAAPLLVQCNNWTGASGITEAAVNLLPRLSPRSLIQSDQQHLMQTCSGLASSAAAFALQTGKSASDSARLLELGRGVISTLHFETRTDLVDLRQKHPKEAEEFERLRDQLDSPSEQQSASTELAKDTPSTSRRNLASMQLDSVILKIRELHGFENFLLPPTTIDLMKVASPRQPCVIINVSFRCDAFIIEQHNIRAFTLTKLNKDEVQRWAYLLRSHRLHKSEMLRMLNWLWDAVAGPVLDELGFTQTVADSSELRPHVCWIPTGALCRLPIHAAGYHTGDFSRTVLDRVTSSYSPSVKALLYALQNKGLRDKAQSIGLDKFVLTCMETTQGLLNRHLPFAKVEIEELGRILQRSLISPVQLESPTRAQVLEQLPGCKVFHFAGHGQSHSADPSKSSLLVADWQQTPLTVKDLVALKLHQNPPFLAYLSACSTGDNQVELLLDEGIHLMGACQLAGFQHVIGSLWEVSDSHCVKAATSVYDGILRAKMSDASVARSLHSAVLNLRGGPDRIGETAGGASRDALPLEAEKRQETGIQDPRIWAAYIHMGI
jgi:CHAT domain-containing protein/tetratricopeptide (TPR) repeat protein